MSTRISNTLAVSAALLSLSACGDNANKTARGEGDRIPCALGGATEFASNCTVERAQTGDGLILTVRHPDGGFHRLRVTTDGRGVIAADGAQEAKVAVVGGGTIEVTIDDARYRLPATVKGGAAK
ncbi:hypothetical protein DAH66_03045 [Sphingomonas koreensis]|jgi:hypothetical protein|uniref:Uncharacterized protein n=1 Tax=Sphingomonas koreensis TaxID=93064 RepID=A0A2M8WIZ7_9SPHN|nr:hypothetical protein BDW16_4217 [Sphingomonas koreensis]RSU60163.1 hypothetical protein DAH56_09500 [Sphingomonas koreensis]RSU68101.1 hypothetical protein DAH55_12340 [Sphingomonas koreensis]RSY89643.1 hypothetical protein DAH66_03045 [Sphingomonas koreensis]